MILDQEGSHLQGKSQLDSGHPLIPLRKERETEKEKEKEKERERESDRAVKVASLEFSVVERPCRR